MSNQIFTPAANQRHDLKVPLLTHIAMRRLYTWGTVSRRIPESSGTVQEAVPSQDLKKNGLIWNLRLSIATEVFVIIPDNIG